MLTRRLYVEKKVIVLAALLYASLAGSNVALAEGVESGSQWTRGGKTVEWRHRASLDRYRGKVRTLGPDGAGEWSGEVDGTPDEDREVTESEELLHEGDTFQVRDYGPDSALYVLGEDGKWHRMRRVKSGGKGSKGPPETGEVSGDETVGGLPDVPPFGFVYVLPHGTEPRHLTPRERMLPRA